MIKSKFIFTRLNITEAKREYTAPIDHKASIPLTKATFYYLTPPNEVNIEKSISAVQDRYPGYPEHNRLESVYSLENESLNKSISTLIFPNRYQSLILKRFSQIILME